MPFHSPLMTHEEYEQSRRLLGPWFIGLSLEFILYGILLAQFHTYYQHYKDDRRWLKLVVAGLFITQLLKSIHSFVTCWIQFVAFFTDLQGAIFLSYTEWWQSAFTLIDASCGLYVQAYFLYRLYIICRKWWVIVIIVAVLIFSYISIIIATILITEAKFNVIARWFAGHYSGVLAGDILIAACTAYFLLTQTKKAILPQTRNLIFALIKLSIQCAVPAVIIAALNLAFSQVYDGTVDLTSVIFNMVLVRVYACSMMFVLNSRKSIVRAHGTSASETISESRTDRLATNTIGTHKTRHQARGSDLELGIQVHNGTLQYTDMHDIELPKMHTIDSKLGPHRKDEREYSIHEKDLDHNTVDITVR
ncbi:hypothetical protein BT69DRAFT_1318279 [Atractiella rhizophila]|nr:hypothetical protein BT69DRAFT_1318279 [Atractiella rhizophila]